MKCWWKVPRRPRGNAGCWVASGRQQVLRCARARHLAGRTGAQSGLRVAGGAAESRLAHPGPPVEHTWAGEGGPEGVGLQGRGPGPAHKSPRLRRLRDALAVRGAEQIADGSRAREPQTLRN